MSCLDRALRMGEAKKFKSYEQRVVLISGFEEEFSHCTDAELREETDALRERARGGESLDDLLPQSFALTREAGKRAMGMRHFDVQLIGGMVLHSGAIAEMKTGEGKTLTGTLAVILNTLGGRGVHVVTVNDYLARRDALWMKPVYDMLGVTVGILQNMQPYEEKRAAYAADVTYGTNSEFGFDYLRDNMAKSLEEKVQHGGREKPTDGSSHYHTFAVVDEVDNILIDEARTPLIISGAPEAAADWYGKFAKLAPKLAAGKTPEGMDPQMKKRYIADFDYEVDEKQKAVSVTELGVAKAERFLGIDHLYTAANGHLVNHLQQSLKAESLFKRDVDYAVIEGEVKIIDEHTGRILDGRRWSEGLHQAIEAKEGVYVQEENQTMATVTLQNYFRMYDKLAGMTGTALTEATEFMKIYELPVVQIPTNQKMIRDDRNDQVYKTKDGKWAAVAREIELRHEARQPVLVGTISVEVSEFLSDQLKRKGITHSVLNAKPEYAEREGSVIAEAGAPGAVTIATNMAGRGVDIKLGGNAEHLTEMEMAKLGLQPGMPDYDEHYQTVLPSVEERIEGLREEVLAAGGLCIIGTERHESRRIDNQLRGRSGRQGDPGESRFFLSAQDDLVRLFAGDRIYKILDKLGGVNEDGMEEPIEAGMLSKQIEKAQRKVEEQYFLQRKHTLEYDDVLNQQREVIYKYRDEVLEGRDMSDPAKAELVSLVQRLVDEYTGGDFVEDWDVDGLLRRVEEIFPPSEELLSIDPNRVDREELGVQIEEELLARYEEREQQLGEEWTRWLERAILLEVIDQHWQEHLYDMDYLQGGIHLRGHAQLDPLVAYKNEAFTLFQDLMHSTWADFAKLIFHAEIQITEAPPEGEEAAPPPPPPPQRAQTPANQMNYSGGSAAAPSPMALAAAGAGAAEMAGAEDEELPPPVEQRRVDEAEQIGRNDPCWCGSEKKYKKCHGA
jgi:preprotein translocase subunit SecA